ncbi:MAG TPA: galactosyldiacylglycerol synthase [Candidatus Limnocylindria bacterium]|nr:galactosyldiacylglycerol synthase [Candidatus Limnocylindria bacterium]
MVQLRDKATGASLGSVTEDDLQFLVDHLEEEFSEDTDYYIDSDTVDMLREAGASAALLAALDTALGDTGEAEIQWTRV